MGAVLDRIVANFEIADSECWEWTAGKYRSGYGAVMATEIGAASNRSAHLVLYEMVVGPVDPGLDLDHLCRNRACINPDHLEPVTRRENLLRGATIPARMAAATQCPSGHPYDAANTYVRPDGKGRDCRACRRHRDQNRSR